MNINPFYQKPIRNLENDPHKSQEMRDLSRIDKKTSKFKTLINFPGFLEEELKPGDIILSYSNKMTNWKEVAILTGQKLKKTGDDIKNRYCHAAIYVGNGKIAEAVDGTYVDKIDIKINRITGKRFANSRDEFRVFRPEGELAATLADLAHQIAKEGKEDPKLQGRYNYHTAIFSSLKHYKKISKSTVENFFKAAYFAHTGEIPIEKHRPQNFHCSYLVSWLMQAAESEKIIEKINEELPPEEQIVFPDLSQLSEQDKEKEIENWCEKLSNTHMLHIFENLMTKLDPESTNVADLFDYLSDHPDLFTYLLRIVPPKDEMEMTEF